LSSLGRTARRRSTFAQKGGPRVTRAKYKSAIFENHRNCEKRSSGRENNFAGGFSKKIWHSA
jgi:hypothetical protein